MLRFRHLALIFLFLSPARRRRRSPVGGQRSPWRFRWRSGLRGWREVRHVHSVIPAQGRSPQSCSSTGCATKPSGKNAPAAWRNPAAMVFFATPIRMEPTSVNSAIPSRRMLSPSAPRTVDVRPTGRHSRLMSLARRLAFAVLGIALGSSGGGVAGLLAGLAYTEIAGTSGFEGYSGFVVAFWILGGVVIGMIAGLVVAYRWRDLATARYPRICSVTSM